MMAQGHGLNVVAIVRSGDVGSALNESCTDMNGTKVDVHVGRLNDVHPDVEIFNGVDVLLLDVDPGSSDELAVLSAIVGDRFPNDLNGVVGGIIKNLDLQFVRRIFHLAGMFDDPSSHQALVIHR